LTFFCLLVLLPSGWGKGQKIQASQKLKYFSSSGIDPNPNKQQPNYTQQQSFCRRVEIQKAHKTNHKAI